MRLSWWGLNVNCSVVCNQGGAANAFEIFVVVTGSVKAAAFYMHIGCACCATYSTATKVVVTYDAKCLIGNYLRRNGIVRLSREFINNISKKICKEFITKEREVG